ncbi:helix-turn-helix domain-containing protein, partial [Streptomyces sp. NPDC004227]
MSELFDAVDALVASRAPLPPAEERRRLRQAHGLTLDDVAAALKVRRATVSGWESVKKTTEPRGPEREAYARLLNKLAELYPAPTPAAVPTTFTGQPAPAEQAPSVDQPSEAVVMTAHENTQTAPAPAAALEAAPRPARTTRPSSTSRRPGAKKATPARTLAGSTDPRFENGPLAVVDVEDGQVLAYCPGGLVLDVPAKSIPALVEWTLKEARLGQPKLSGPGKDADPLIVLTEAALERYGLPVALTDEERLAGRIPEGHKVIKQLARADWKLTKRGFGPWARIYRPAQGSERACVQLCIPSWHALDTRHWGEAGQLPPAELARVLGV